MRDRFVRQLEQLNTELIEMGSLCERAITFAMKAVRKNDVELAQDAINLDHEIDQKERDVENLCLKLLLKQQPVAKDLRQISAALKMITDMERIGDQAGDIAEIVQLVDVHEYAERLQLGKMANAAILMVTDSVDAYVKKDLELARKVIEDDAAVDAQFDRIKTTLIANIQENGPDYSPECAIDLLMISKYLERIGDHASNIAEWVEYSLTGVHRSHESVEE